MAEERFEELSTERLTRRKNLGSALLFILIAAAVLDGAAFIYDLFTDNKVNIYLMIMAIACLIIALPISLGLKKVKKELAGR